MSPLLLQATLPMPWPRLAERLYSACRASRTVRWALLTSGPAAPERALVPWRGACLRNHAAARAVDVQVNRLGAVLRVQVEHHSDDLVRDFVVDFLWPGPCRRAAASAESAHIHRVCVCGETKRVARKRGSVGCAFASILMHDKARAPREMSAGAQTCPRKIMRSR